MFNPKVAYENLEIVFNEPPFYLGGSNVPNALNLNSNLEEANDLRKVKGRGLKPAYIKNLIHYKEK